MRSVQGREITTLEGLGTLESLHPLQQAFAEEQAVQCGFCVPGMIISAKVLLDRNPHPTNEEIKAEMAGNLCRCGVYDRISIARGQHPHATFCEAAPMSEFKHKPNAEQVVERWDRFWAGDDLSPPIHSLRVPGAGLSMGGHGHCDMHEAPDAFFHKMLGAVEARRCLPDDAIPMFIPPFSHAMVPAVFGAEVRLEGRRFFAKPGIRTMAELVETSFSPEAEWWRKVEGFYSRLLDLAHGLLPVGLYEIPAPADLIGGLLGYTSLFLMFQDQPELARRMTMKCAEWAIELNQRIQDLLEERQASFGGTWMANCWAPGKSLYFSEHSSVNFSPRWYAEFLKAANDKMIDAHSCAVSWIYAKEGKHLLHHYFNRPRRTLIHWSGEEGMDESYFEEYPDSLFSISCASDEFHEVYRRCGGQRILYDISCESVDQARAFGLKIGTAAML